jgi:carboxyl-terminal processing protease
LYLLKLANEDDMRGHLKLAGAVVGIALALAVIQTNASAAETSQRDRLLAAFDRIRANYVDQLDESELVTAAINGMIGVLDSGSVYIDPKDFANLQNPHRHLGDVGLGLQIAIDKGFVRVVAPFDDSPAAKAGLILNDIITHINGVPLQGLKAYQVVDKTAGPANTSVRLTVMRAGYDKPIELTVARQMITARSVRMRQDGQDIGYIRIATLDETTMPNFATAIAELRGQLPPDKIKGYVLDLRNTTGLPLDGAVSVADAFLEDGEIVSVHRRDPERTERLNARPGDIIDGKPLIVLINGGTADGAEIVVGALQDHKRATVIGSRSFGRGSAQTILPLGRGNGAVRLTTGRYFTPAGHSIDAVGIRPDIEAVQDFPQPPENDKALTMAFELLRGIASDPGFPPH